MSRDKCQIDSRALIASPQISAEVLSAVPIQSSKKLDIGQRRTRRPFSVSEVEALVHAVERLGTGRYVADIIMHVSLSTCTFITNNQIAIMVLDILCFGCSRLTT